MGEITISIPDELEKDIRRVSKLKLSLAVAKMVKSELDKIALLKSIIDKSQLLEDDVRELSERTDMELSKKFRESVR